MSITTIRRSRDSMAKTLQRLNTALRRTPEEDVGMREVLIRKMEMLRIIRIEMKKLMREL